MQFPADSTALYFKYSVGLATQYPYVIITSMFATILWTFFWQIILTKLGKKTGLFITLNLTLPILIFYLFLNYFPPGSYVVIIFSAMSTSGVYLFEW